MAILRLGSEKQVMSLKPVLGGPGKLYEDEVEDLIWNNTEQLTGEGLFPVARQPKVAGGGIPDIVALDSDARVVVIEVKRDIEREQLSQCLEYAGWAQDTSLDELASFYAAGKTQFFKDWAEFTDGDGLQTVSPNPRCVLVAKDYHSRTKAALRYVTSGDLHVTAVTIAVYEDQSGVRFLEVSGVAAPKSPTSKNAVGNDSGEPNENVTLADLLEFCDVKPGEALVWERPQLGETYTATITADGEIELPDGKKFGSPSGAAKAAADIPAYNGWNAWRVVRTGQSFKDLSNKVVRAKHAARYGNTGTKYKEMEAELKGNAP